MAVAGGPGLRPGDLLAGRYRLEDLVAEPDGSEHGSSLWRAVDEVLARPVAVKLLPAAGRASADAAQPFLRAAGLASTLAHPGLARVYDAAVEERKTGGRRNDVAYVISEWVEGQTLAELLVEGPVEPSEAVRLAVQACEAITAAHARGAAHGRLHLGNVLVTPGPSGPGSASGRVVITDAVVAAAVAGVDAGLSADDAAARESLVADDTRDLGAVAYALLTARWPADATPQPAAGVATAPGRDRRTYSPRQVRAGVPKELDAVVTRALAPRLPGGSGGFADPRSLAAALEQARRVGVPAVVVPAAYVPPGKPKLWKRALPWVAALAFIGAFATGTYALGKAIGELPGREGSDLEALTQPTPKSSPGATKAVKIPLDAAGVTVKDFDPQGDGSERPAEVINAFDGDVSTSWLTSRYRSDSFGGLKDGVGLLVDLGAVTPLVRVDVALTTGGGDLEVLVGDTAPADVTALRRVAQQKGATGVVRLGVPAATRARYVLIWITKLPRGDGGFQEGIDELVLVR